MHKSGYRNIPKFWFLIVLGGAFAMAMGKRARSLDFETNTNIVPLYSHQLRGRQRYALVGADR